MSSGGTTKLSRRGENPGGVLSQGHARAYVESDWAARGGRAKARMAGRAGEGSGMVGVWVIREVDRERKAMPMPRPTRAADAAPSKATRRKRASAGTLALLALAAITLGATAFGARPALTVRSASNAKLRKQGVVNPQGRTLYVLSPETSKHLLCKSKECLTNWPPVLAKSAKAKLKAGTG